MGKINVLDFEIANLIAAGEVVERPSSVLKELIENSIDSGATSIVAEIKRGGVALIRVSDNGCGIDEEDLPVAIKRHATSKIKAKEDLESIMTLGFRGEALAAISSVSAVTIITKTKASAVGAMLSSEGGRIIDISEVGCANGTTVVVENLFFNVPARRKFLKKDSTEAMNCAALVEKVALSRPDISIQLISDGEERFKTPGDGNLLNTVYAVFGKDFSSKLIETEGTANGVRVHGYIGRSDNVRRNRNLQNVFINGRYVKSLTAMAAIEKAYTSYIAPEAFPVCVLFLDMNPSMVDVNVHPAKLEVKFSNEQPIFEAIYYTVKNAIESYQYRPEMTIAQKRREQSALGAFVAVGENTKGEQISISNSYSAKTGNQAALASKSSACHSTERLGQSNINSVDYDKTIRVSSSAIDGIKKRDVTPSYKESVMTPKSSLDILKKYSEASSEVSLRREAVGDRDLSIKPKENLAEEESKPFEYKLVGEIFNCYVIVEYDNQILVIDKHAAHERVLFEDLKKESEKQGSVTSQSLLLPITVMLTPEEISAADEFKKDISSVGFDFEICDGYANLNAIPSNIGSADADGLLVNMIDDLMEGKGHPEVTEAIRREKALYQIACKAAIKGGRVYDESVIRWLVEKLLLLPDVIVCPHGRPVAFKLTKNELDRQFERIK